MRGMDGMQRKTVILPGRDGNWIFGNRMVDPRFCERRGTLFISLLSWLAVEVCWLAVEVLSPSLGLRNVVADKNLCDAATF